MSDFDAYLTRRNIVRSAAILPFAALRSSAANSAVTVGLIGTGSRGTYVTSALAKNTPARVVALCDVVDSKIERAKTVIGVEDPKIYKDFRKLLESDVDAVIIATPVYLHPEHFEAAVKAGKHIYIEKPAGVDVAGCKRVMRLADSADRKLNITFGFQRRYAPVYLKAKQVVDSGVIGPIRMGHAHFIKSEAGGNVVKQPRPATEFEKGQNWHIWRDLSGDLIVENNVHLIDVLNWFMGGRPKSAVGSGSAILPKRGDNRDCNFVAYEYNDGRQGQLSGTTVAPRNYRHVTEQFFGESGMVETSENFWRHFQSGKQDITEKSPHNITIDSVTEFVKRISEGKPENVGTRGAESTLTAILGRMAMDARREVTWEDMMKEG
jgi:myo-inositol 2-dehydrogenase / D-chiro-inositol 1-dehydrogenase